MSIPEESDPIPLGTPVELTATYKNQAGEPKSPTNPVIFIVDPGNKRQQIPRAELTETGEGVFTYIFTPGRGGRWRAYTRSTQGLIAASPKTVFWVEDQEVQS